MDRDRYDLPLTTTSDRAAAHYRDGVDRMPSAWQGAEDAFDRAIRRVVACLRAGHGDKAAKLISARLDRRAFARDEASSREAQIRRSTANTSIAAARPRN